MFVVSGGGATGETERIQGRNASFKSHCPSFHARKTELPSFRWPSLSSFRQANYHYSMANIVPEHGLVCHNLTEYDDVEDDQMSIDTVKVSNVHGGDEEDEVSKPVDLAMIDDLLLLRSLLTKDKHITALERSLNEWADICGKHPSGSDWSYIFYHVHMIWVDVYAAREAKGSWDGVDRQICVLCHKLYRTGRNLGITSERTTKYYNQCMGRRHIRLTQENDPHNVLRWKAFYGEEFEIPKVVPKPVVPMVVVIPQDQEIDSD